MKLQECIKEIKLLTWLDVGGCDLDCLPQGVGQLEKLSNFMLKDNKKLIKPLECIGKMKLMTHLDIGGCRWIISLKECDNWRSCPFWI